MRYTEIIVYREATTVCDFRAPRAVTAYRVSAGHGYETKKRLSIADMYRGHCQWIAEQINPRNERKAA